MSHNRMAEADAELPTVDEGADRLRRAGWSCGVFATAGGWTVSGTNGENRIEATAATQGEAWERAVEAARAVGMLCW